MYPPGFPFNPGGPSEPLSPLSPIKQNIRNHIYLISQLQWHYNFQLWCSNESRPEDGCSTQIKSKGRIAAEIYGFIVWNAVNELQLIKPVLLPRIPSLYYEVLAAAEEKKTSKPVFLVLCPEIIGKWNKAKM